MNTLLCILLFSAKIFSSEILLYQDRDYGSDSQFNPITFYFNNTFDTIQNPYLFSQKDFLRKHETVYKRIRSPISTINNLEGFDHLFVSEFIGERSVPNYTVHLIGGGYDFRKLAEWYEVNNYPLAFTLSFLTTYASKFGNEAIESTDTQNIGPEDHIADLYFFDLAGNLLFMNNRVVTFFRDDLSLVSWGGQPLYAPKTDDFTNTMSQYIVRPNLGSKQWRPFILFGMQALFGISYRLSEKESLSLGSGVAMTDPIHNKGRFATGLFYDKADSLMSSLLINSTENFRYRLNLYPGILKYKNLSPGFLLAEDREDKIFLGMNLILPIGIAGIL